MVVFKRHKTNYVKKEISSRINMIEIRDFLGVFPLFHTKSSVLTMELFPWNTGACTKSEIVAATMQCYCGKEYVDR